ncbi:secretion protein HlyD [Paludibacterium yongneupense]|uniref:secretion protein HlyD n=1 Tax=Paludibacterium yongneupense TaxID=400061 RepID=UPI0004292516|nr:secretion protein HlyD [Paludibacterium yongneupense]
MQRRSLILIGAAAVLALAAGWAWHQSRRDDGSLTLYGNIDIRSVNLAFRVGGRLQTLNVDEGAIVHAGQPLGQLDAEPLRHALADAEANRALQAANAALYHHGTRQQDVAAARANLAGLNATLAGAEKALARQQQLAGTGAAPARALDDARATRDAAAAQAASAAQKLDALSQGFRREEVAAADANLKRADAALASARLQWQDSTLVAPSDGVIMTRAVEPGSMLGAGATVFTLSLTRPVWARVYIGETELGRAAIGRAVTLYSDSRPGHPYHGRIGFVSPAAEFTPKNVETEDLRSALVYRVRIVVQDPDAALRQGMPITVVLPAR